MPPKGAIRVGADWLLEDGTLVSAGGRRHPASRAATPSRTPPSSPSPPGSWHFIPPEQLSPRTQFPIVLTGQQTYAPQSANAAIAPPWPGGEVPPGLVAFPPLTEPRAAGPKTPRTKKPPPSACAQCCRRLRKATAWGHILPWLFVLAAISAVAYMGGTAAQGAIEALSKLVASGAEATSVVAGSAANLTVAVSDVAVAVSRGGVSIISEVWAGVDMIDACCHAHGAKWYMQDGQQAADLLGTPMGRQLSKLPEDERLFVLESIDTVGPTYPAFASCNSSVSLNGSFRHFSSEVRWFSAGYVGVRFIYGEILFRPQWSNPLWELVFDVTAEEETLVERLYDTLRRAIRADWVWEQLDIDQVADSLIPMSSLEMAYNSFASLARQWRRALTR